MSLPDPDTASPAEVPRRPRGRPRKTADERDDGNRRQDLLRAAARLFRQQGFAATSTRDIAAAAGMRSGSPFYHFENKEVLLAAVMLEGMQRATGRQAAAIHAAAAAAGKRLSARECLRVLVRNHLEVLLGAESDFIPVMLYEWRSLSEVQRQAVNELRQRVRGRLGAGAAGAARQRRAAGRPEPGAADDLRRAQLGGAVVRAGAPVLLDDLTEAALRLFLKEAI